MALYEFTVRLDRVPDDDGLNALFEAGLDDSTPEIDNGAAVLHMAREADSLARSIVTAVADIETAGYQAVGIESEDLVTLADIAARTGRTRESVRLLSLGKRGPGGFPAPVTSGTWALYSWAVVREWFRTHYGDQATAATDSDADTLASADLLLRARLLTPDMSELNQLIAV